MQHPRGNAEQTDLPYEEESRQSQSNLRSSHTRHHSGPTIASPTRPHTNIPCTNLQHDRASAAPSLNLDGLAWGRLQARSWRKAATRNRRMHEEETAPSQPGQTVGQTRKRPEWSEQPRQPSCYVPMQSATAMHDRPRANFGADAEGACRHERLHELSNALQYYEHHTETEPSRAWQLGARLTQQIRQEGTQCGAISTLPRVG